MSLSPAIQTTPAAQRQMPIASWTHTAAFAGLFLLVAAAGGLFQQHATTSPASAPSHPHVAPLYISLIVMEWALVLWVARAMRSRGTRLRHVIAGRWKGARDIARDVALAFCIWLVWIAGQTAWSTWLGPGHAASVGGLLPRSPAEIVLWLGLSISAGFCEEVAFRGYLQTQFEALTGTALLSIPLQALVFGIAHGYEGMDATIRIAAYATLLGIVARSRRSLRPGMLAHAWSDIFAGLL